MHILEAEKRGILGKTKKRLPKEKMAAVYYGHREKTTPITVERSQFKKVWEKAGESSVITLKEGGKEMEALIHDVQFDPIKSEPRHADFYILEKGKKVEVTVPLQFEGVAPAVKNLGGILVKVMRDIEIEAAPKDLPHSLIVDVSTLLDFESQILIGDLKLPEGVVAKGNLKEVVALVEEPKEEAPEEEAPPADLSSIEVEKKGKKEDDEASGEKSDSGESAKEEQKAE